MNSYGQYSQPENLFEYTLVIVPTEDEWTINVNKFHAI